MKRISVIVLCLVVAGFALVGCSQPTPQERKQYYNTLTQLKNVTRGDLIVNKDGWVVIVCLSPVKTAGGIGEDISLLVNEWGLWQTNIQTLSYEQYVRRVILKGDPDYTDALRHFAIRDKYYKEAPIK